MYLQEIQQLRQQTGAGMMDCKRALVQFQGDIEQALAYLHEQGFRLAEKKAERLSAEGTVYAEVVDGRAVLIELGTETDFVATNAQFLSYVKEIAHIAARYNPQDVTALLACPCGSETVGDQLRQMVLRFGENITIRRVSLILEGLPFAYRHPDGRIGVILGLGAAENDLALQAAGKELALQIAAMAPLHISREDLGAEFMRDLRSRILLDIAEDDSLKQKPPQVRDKAANGRIEKYLRTKCLLEQAYIRDSGMTVKQYLESACTAQVTMFYRYEKAEGMQAESNAAYAQELARAKSANA